MTKKPEPMLFLDDHRGIYIPRDFAQSVKRECVANVSDEDFAILLQPDHDAYWDCWDDVMRDAVITDSDGIKWTLYQDGALWLIPEGMEWSDDTEWFEYPVDDPEDDAEAYSRGWDRGNYGNAYESTSWRRWSRKNRFSDHSTAYQEGMLLGFHSSYELDEINDEETREWVAALRIKHSEEI